MKAANIIEVIKNEFNIKLYPNFHRGEYYTSKNDKVYLREYPDYVFVSFKLTRNGIDIELYKTIRNEQELSNLIKLIKKAKRIK